MAKTIRARKTTVKKTSQSIGSLGLGCCQTPTFPLYGSKGRCFDCPINAGLYLNEPNGKSLNYRHQSYFDSSCVDCTPVRLPCTVTSNHRQQRRRWCSRHATDCTRCARPPYHASGAPSGALRHADGGRAVYGYARAKLWLARKCKNGSRTFLACTRTPYVVQKHRNKSGMVCCVFP